MMILVGPSGVGKSSFLDRALEEIPSIMDIITYTTRSMRTGEEEGQPYHFISRDEFEKRIEQGFFVEWAEVHGNLYGSSADQLEQAWSEGKVVVMDVDVQGAKTIKEKYPQCMTVFILPPSSDALRQRVIKREGGEPKDLNLRMENAVKEMELAETFDRQIVNSDFETAYSEIKKMIEDLTQTR